MAHLSDALSSNEIQSLYNCISNSRDFSYTATPPVLSGIICSGMDEDETGWHGCVTIEPESKCGQMAYVDHKFTFSKFCIKMREGYKRKDIWTINGRRFKFDFQGDVLESMIYQQIKGMIKPFDFENYFISFWDSDAYPENVPYGNVGLLEIGGCTFLIDADIDYITIDNIRKKLRLLGWSVERIEQHISNNDYLIHQDFYKYDFKIVFKHN